MPLQSTLNCLVSEQCCISKLPHLAYMLYELSSGTRLTLIGTNFTYTAVC